MKKERLQHKITIKEKTTMEKKERDKRRQSRETHLETLTFTIMGSFSGKKEFLPSAVLKGTIIDISETGLGIFTEARLEPGMVVKFSEIKGTDVAVVMWTIDLGNLNRIGFKF